MQNDDDRSNVVPFRGSSPPAASGVMRVARKSSGSYTVAPVDVFRRAYRDSTEGALAAFETAAEFRRAGNELAALVAEASADEFLDLALEAGVEIASL